MSLWWTFEIYLGVYIYSCITKILIKYQKENFAEEHVYREMRLIRKCPLTPEEVILINFIYFTILLIRRLYHLYFVTYISYQFNPVMKWCQYLQGSEATVLCIIHTGPYYGSISSSLNLNSKSEQYSYGNALADWNLHFLELF